MVVKQVTIPKPRRVPQQKPVQLKVPPHLEEVFFQEPEEQRAVGDFFRRTIGINPNLAEMKQYVMAIDANANMNRNTPQEKLLIRRLNSIYRQKIKENGQGAITALKSEPLQEFPREVQSQIVEQAFPYIPEPARQIATLVDSVGRIFTKRREDELSPETTTASGSDAANGAASGSGSKLDYNA